MNIKNVFASAVIALVAGINMSAIAAPINHRAININSDSAQNEVIKAQGNNTIDAPRPTEGQDFKGCVKPWC